MRPDGLSGAGESGEEPWFEHLKKFVDRGARCFKLDASQQCGDFPGRVWAKKFTSDEVHNVYPVVYAKQMARGYEVYTGRRAMVYTSCGYLGSQRYVASWAGAVIPMWPLKQHLEKGWNDEIEVHVWPGDGSFDLYEDDGETLGYRAGESTVTPLVWRGGLLDVGTRRGSFKGMPRANRPFRLVRHGF